MAVYMTAREKFLLGVKGLGVCLGKEILGTILDLAVSKMTAQELAVKFVSASVSLQKEIVSFIEKYGLSSEAGTDLKLTVLAYQNLLQRYIEEAQNCEIVISRNDIGELTGVTVKMNLIPKGIKKFIDKKKGDNTKRS